MLEIMKPLCLMACLLFAVGGQSIAETIKPPPPGLKKKFQAVHGVVESAGTSNKAYIREQKNKQKQNDSKSLDKTYGPYRRGTVVVTRRTVAVEQYVRVFNKNKGGRPNGSWFMKAADIKGLTPKQIQQKFALINTPTHFVKVTLGSGAGIKHSTAAGKNNSLFGRKEGKGKQYQSIGGRVRFSENAFSIGKKFSY